MSDKGRNYVDAHSPYAGVTFLIHYRLGDLENDTHDHRLFIGERALAQKCRCSTKTIQRARAQMVADGFLELLSPESPGRPAEYRFLFPKSTVDILSADATVDIVSADGGHPVPDGGHLGKSHLSIGTKRTKGTERQTAFVTDFAELWATYPKKVDRGAALAKYQTLRRRGVAHADLMVAVARYVRSKAQDDPKYLKHLATLLGPTEAWREHLPADPPKPRAIEPDQPKAPASPMPDTLRNLPSRSLPRRSRQTA